MRQLDRLTAASRSFSARIKDGAAAVGKAAGRRITPLPLANGACALRNLVGGPSQSWRPRGSVVRHFRSRVGVVEGVRETEWVLGSCWCVMGRAGGVRCAAFVGWRVEELGRVVLGCAELGLQRVGGAEDSG